MTGRSAPLGSFADWQLDEPSTPESTLADIVARAAGSGIDRLERILEGYSNEVYRVRCVDRQQVVIRILRFDEDVSRSVAEGEAAAIELARSAGVPAPEILLLDTIAVDGAEFPVMVQRAVPGRPLGSVITDLDDVHREQVLVEIGALVARINAVEIPGDHDWNTAMAADLANRRAERDKIIGAGFTGTEFDRMLELLEAYVEDFPCRQWVLCHGDLSAKHIFVTDSGAARVSGIIDFGDWKPGAPVHDLAVLRAREPELEVQPLLAGYGLPGAGACRRRLDLHTLMIALAAVAFGVAEQDDNATERSAALVRSLITDLDDPECTEDLR